MWQYVIRRLLYNVPVYLGILLFVMVALRVNDPVWARLGKNATQEDYDNEKVALGLSDPLPSQYWSLLTTFDMDQESEAIIVDSEQVGPLKSFHQLRIVPVRKRLVSDPH